MKAGQSKKHSLLESLINVAIGYGIAVTAQIIVFPWFGIHIPLRQNLTIGLIFTVVSIARSYILRRAFNWYHLISGEKDATRQKAKPATRRVACKTPNASAGPKRGLRRKDR